MYYTNGAGQRLWVREQPLEPPDCWQEEACNMYNEYNPHCRECICPTCTAFQTEWCQEGPNVCADCDNKEHTARCPWYDKED